VLDRQFTADQLDRKWIADFTHVWTAEGWLYLAAVIDLFSRRVVGWSMKSEMSAQLVTDALLMAIWRRGRPGALLHHSDSQSIRAGSWSDSRSDGPFARLAPQGDSVRPDLIWSRDRPASVPAKPFVHGQSWRLGMAVIEGVERSVVGGVNAYKDLHVAAVVDEQDRVPENP
jgi:Integrase core domain